MPNKSSKAGHIPQRTCQTCRVKLNKKDLLRFGLISNNFVFDTKQQLNSYGYYVCNNNKCIMKLDQWLKKKIKRKRGVKKIG